MMISSMCRNNVLIAPDGTAKLTDCVSVIMTNNADTIMSPGTKDTCASFHPVSTDKRSFDLAVAML